MLTKPPTTPEEELVRSLKTVVFHDIHLLPP
jgi:hypothetical protein